MRSLERAGVLDRQVEFLPDEETIAERHAAGKGLTRPELSVLLAYSKMALFERLLETDVPDDPYLVHDVGLYFPKPLRKQVIGSILRRLPEGRWYKSLGHQLRWLHQASFLEGGERYARGTWTSEV